MWCQNQPVTCYDWQAREAKKQPNMCKTNYTTCTVLEAVPTSNYPAKRTPTQLGRETSIGRKKSDKTQEQCTPTTDKHRFGLVKHLSTQWGCTVLVWEQSDRTATMLHGQQNMCSIVKLAWVLSQKKVPSNSLCGKAHTSTSNFEVHESAPEPNLHWLLLRAGPKTNSWGIWNN